MVLQVWNNQCATQHVPETPSLQTYQNNAAISTIIFPANLSEKPKKVSGQVA